MKGRKPQGAGARVPTRSANVNSIALDRLAYALRARVVTMLHHAQAGHPGGSLSAAEILTALYFSVMRLDPANPRWDARDRFVLSKGHASAMYYAVLQERGFFDRELLMTYDQIDSCLQAHPDCQTPGVDAPSGSLGQGLSVGLGMALGERLKTRDTRVYVLLGDGELQEGQVWEAAMAAAHFRLASLTAIVDYNQLQLTGPTNRVMGIEPLAAKWLAFGWGVLEVDGHSVTAVADACMGEAPVAGQPTAIIAHTIKGKGVSFMEGDPTWHSAPISDDDRERALAELTEAERRLS